MSERPAGMDDKYNAMVWEGACMMHDKTSAEDQKERQAYISTYLDHEVRGGGLEAVDDDFGMQRASGVPGVHLAHPA